MAKKEVGVDMQQLRPVMIVRVLNCYFRGWEDDVEVVVERITLHMTAEGPEIWKARFWNAHDPRGYNKYRTMWAKDDMRFLIVDDAGNMSIADLLAGNQTMEWVE